jgi:uncharacterized YigZ family protein
VSAYRAPAGEGRGEVREKGSRFLAVVRPAADAAAAREVIAELGRAYGDATHRPWAWRLGAAAAERSSDAGEPAGTAGVPMLQVLRGAELSDAVAVVARWFGGTKLGKGGLARAYAAAVREALAGLAVAERAATAELTLELPYERLGAVKRLLHPPEVELAGERYGAVVSLRLRVREESLEPLAAALADLGLAVRAGGAGERLESSPGLL